MASELESVPAPAAGAPTAPQVDRLTPSQAARRARVIVAALELAASGGYDAVQMRDVAARAGVALGTIYRYFPSKDALLVAVMVEWAADLERRVTRHPATGATTADRIVDVLGRALAAMGRNPALTKALITAMTAGDPAGVVAMAEMSGTLGRLLGPAFPPDADPAARDAAVMVIGHVWWSATISAANGVGDAAWVSAQLRQAAVVVTERFDSAVPQVMGPVSP